MARGRAVRSSATGGATRRSASAGVRAQARECGRAGGAAWAWAGEAAAGPRRSAEAGQRGAGLGWLRLAGQKRGARPTRVKPDFFKLI